MMRQLVIAVFVFAGVSNFVSCGSPKDVMKIKSPPGIGPKLRTDIALVGADSSSTSIKQQQPSVYIDPSKFVSQASDEFRDSDIEEDPADRFITTRSGKYRVELVDVPEYDWANDSPLVKKGKVLIRKKRCGGGDDDGDANRARRVRRNRVARKVSRQRKAAKRARKAAKRAAKRAAKTRTTTITRTILPANQVYPAQAGIQTTTTAQGQVYVQPQQPGGVIQTIQTTQPIVQTTETVHHQPAQVQYITPATQVQPLQIQPQIQLQGQAMAGVQPLAMGGAASAVAVAA